MRQGFIRSLATSALAFALTGNLAAQDRPDTEGSVWVLSFVRVKPGMSDVHMRDLAGTRKRTVDEARKQGLIVSDRILTGAAMGRDDWDVAFLVEYRNWAAFDGLDEKFTLIERSFGEREELIVEGMVKRRAMSDSLGDKTMQEIVLKP